MLVWVDGFNNTATSAIVSVSLTQIGYYAIDE
jgi:hypothetical protein